MQARAGRRRTFHFYRQNYNFQSSLRILAKMGELGWTDELSDYRTEKAFLALPAVRQNKELTNRGL
jgi:hypothetical protein